MEMIRRAIERSQTGTAASVRQRPHVALEAPLQPAIAPPGIEPAQVANTRTHEFVLNGATLEAHRIVAHDVASPLRKSFDILRTQVLQAMDDKDFHLLAVTSPSAGCGKTVTAVNLALSIARQPQRSVLLIDMDLQRPRIGTYLGLPSDRGLLGVLEGRLSLAEAMVQARIGTCQFSVVLAERSTQDSSEWMASPAMTAFLKEVRQASRSHVVIIDLPPMLASDDVMAILPQIDCVLFVAAAGVSTTSEIQDCTGHLQSTEVIRVVLNKASEANVNYAKLSY